ncbi:hypothetical protein [Afifella sp. IM 167]|uniref:hypothetical protein n=1 Tax=Afifella sp. IM 167 TaxID=2033586 RepID=UPI001CCC7205|nr:hypothetical protein [Afifella sp. IM 167]
MRALCLLAALGLLAAPAGARELRAAGYAFSDELGGFRLVGLAGSGTTADPFILHEEIDGVGPVTLVVRRIGMEQRYSPRGWMALHLRKVVENLSGRIWAGFDMELQERLNVPSIYGDGLSFDQGRLVPEEVSSDAFSESDRRFEPYDRLRFFGGSVDPGRNVRFAFHITDPTPTGIFYLVQDPQTLFAARPGGTRLAAAPPPSAPVAP